ncbi:MAG: hypothetical protein HC783_15075 [Rhodobacteraceae bacterium]|nr:hypothetical protein [Paracoccaceae bacterium]
MRAGGRLCRLAGGLGLWLLAAGLALASLIDLTALVQRAAVPIWKSSTMAAALFRRRLSARRLPSG